MPWLVESLLTKITSTLKLEVLLPAQVDICVLALIDLVAKYRSIVMGVKAAGWLAAPSPILDSRDLLRRLVCPVCIWLPKLEIPPSA